MLPRVLMSVLTYRLIPMTRKEPEGYVARCSQFGVASAGDSPSEVLVNLKEATNLYLENMMLTAGLIPMKCLLQVSF